MKFKVLKGTPLFDKLNSLGEEMTEYNKAAFDLVKKLGYTRMRGKSNVLAGGISSIEIKGGKPVGWRNAYSGVRDEYFPAKLKANKMLLAEIDALPVVEYDDLNKILNFDWRTSSSRNISFHPGIHWGKKEILIDVSRHYTSYKPVKGMIEILESEYMKLVKKLESENKKK